MASWMIARASIVICTSSDVRRGDEKLRIAVGLYAWCRLRRNKVIGRWNERQKLDVKAAAVQYALNQGSNHVKTRHNPTRCRNACSPCPVASRIVDQLHRVGWEIPHRREYSVLDSWDSSNTINGEYCSTLVHLCGTSVLVVLQ
jgi:hypothetical protein